MIKEKILILQKFSTIDDLPPGNISFYIDCYTEDNLHFLDIYNKEFKGLIADSETRIKEKVLKKFSIYTSNIM